MIMKATKLYEEKLVDFHEEHHEHHEQSFIRKYIFSEDHKTIAKQFLITGIFWALVGGALSFLFRIVLNLLIFYSFTLIYYCKDYCK